MLFNLFVVAVVVLVAFLLLPQQVKARLGLADRLDKAAQESTERRLSYYAYGVNLFLENPFLGSGLGGFTAQYHRSIYRFWLNQGDVLRVAHNMYLEIGIGAGLLGLIPFLMILLSCLTGLQGLVRKKPPSSYAELASALQISMVGFMMVGLISSSQYDKPLWLLISMAAVLPVLDQNEESMVTVETV
jgi:O-antigen ligase